MPGLKSGRSEGRRKLRIKNLRVFLGFPGVVCFFEPAFKFGGQLADNFGIGLGDVGELVRVHYIVK